MNGQGAGTFMEKAIYRSADGGLTWELRANAQLPGSPEPDVGSLPLGGHFPRVVAVSDDTAVMALGRGGTMGSFDGGRTWAPLLPPETDDGAGFGIRGFTFVDELRGWAFGPPGVYRTTDGAHTWERLTLPDPPP